jgi:endonuclease YncB( thermonuclease family)
MNNSFQIKKINILDSNKSKDIDKIPDINITKTNILESTSLINIKNEDINLFSLNGIETTCKIVDIYDADTCKIVFILNNSIVKFNCRLSHIDSPEIKPSRKFIHRDIEIKAAKKCRNKLIQLCTNCSCTLECILNKKIKQKYLSQNTKLLKVRCGEFDKYGRLLIELYDQGSDKSVNNLLIDEKYVHHYSGKTKKKFTLEELNYILDN